MSTLLVRYVLLLEAKFLLEVENEITRVYTLNDTYFRVWTGASMQWRLKREIRHCKLFCWDHYECEIRGELIRSLEPKNYGLWDGGEKSEILGRFNRTPSMIK